MSPDFVELLRKYYRAEQRYEACFEQEKYLKSRTPSRAVVTRKGIRVTDSNNFFPHKEDAVENAVKERQKWLSELISLKRTYLKVESSGQQLSKRSCC